MADVLIVGAGPTGLAVGCLLQGYGVATRIIDRLAEPAELAKAVVIWSRSLEILDEIGVANAVAAQAIPLAWATYSDGCRRLAAIPTNRIPDTRWQPLILPQNRLEGLLRDRYRVLGGSIEWSTGLVAVTSGAAADVAAGAAGGVECAVARSGHRAGPMTAAYLVGCDGMRSAVRRTSGIPTWDAAPHPGVFLLGDLTVDTALDRGAVHHFLGHTGFSVLIPLPGGRWRMIGFLDGHEPDGTIGRECLQRVLTECGHRDTAIRRVHWSGTFRVTRRLAATFRAGRILLAGDAAHVHSPAGGQGLNAGIQDAHNLAWKLALAAQGLADPRLLDSYVEERRPIAASILRITQLQDEWIAGVRSAPARFARNALMRLLMRAGWPERSAIPEMAQLRVDYRRSPLTAGQAPRRGGFRPGFRLAPQVFAPDGTARVTLWLTAGDGADAASLRTFAARYAGSLRVHTGPATGLGITARRPSLVGVRPDGHVGFHEANVRFRAAGAVSTGLPAWVSDALALVPTAPLPALCSR
jgi:2-polyprenyl-6-methoxyphenol hydroxylase-like FAD-dependent oxidoreductase